MKRNPFKDKTIPKPTTPKPQPIVQTEEQKAFEAEVQERIRQAKMQLKAENPFDKDEAQIESTASGINEEKLVNQEAGAKSFEDEVQERIRQAKMELKSSNPSNKEGELDSLTTSTQASINHDTENRINEWTKKWNEQSQELDRARQQIKILENKLTETSKTSSANHTTSKSDRKPVYGMAASVPNTENITKDDLKLEFLNFTSAHIDQFNTRIKKTEELVAALAGNQPQEAQKEKSKTPWTQWLNTALLALCTALLLGLYLKNNSGGDKQIDTTTSTKKESSPIVSQTEAKPTVATNITPSNTQKEKLPAAATTNNSKIEAKPTPISNSTNTVTSTVAKTTIPVQPSKPAAQNVASTPTQPIKPTTTPPINISKPAPAATTVPARPVMNAKPVASSPTPAMAPKKIVPTAPAAPAAKKAPLSNPVSNAKPATKPVAKTVPTPKPTIVNKQPAKQIREKKQQNLAEAIRPVENDVAQRRKQTTTNNKSTIARKANNSRNSNTEEPKPVIKTQSSKPKQQTNDVFFGDD